MSARIQKISSQILERRDFNTLAVIGDPGCEGLGADSMRIYAAALQEASKSDLILVAGDLVPTGEPRYYETVCGITENIAQKDVFVLRGNHDTGRYESSFGLGEYAVTGPRLTLIVLDNASRRFTESGLELLKKVLERGDTENAVIAFHIPVPNRFTTNTVSAEDYEPLRKICAPWKQKIRAFVCGHVHSRFEDAVDGIPLICTGGGGAMIEDVSEKIRAAGIDYHIVRFFFDSAGKLSHEIVNLSERPYTRETADPVLQSQLEATVKNELYAHLRYLIFAERARKRGHANLADLFTKLAESEYRHARNFFALREVPAAFDRAMPAFLSGETFEYADYYKMMGDAAEKRGFSISAHAYRSAREAEGVHARLIAKLESLPDSEVPRIEVCPACGFVRAVNPASAGERCPICGAPGRSFL